MRALLLRLTAARRMTLALALVAPLALSACGERGDARAFVTGEVAREGIAVPLDGIDYEVFITRELNRFDPEDRQYLQAYPPAPPGAGYYGVFLQACALEENEGPVDTSGRIEVVDIRGNEYRPLPLSPQNVFAYRVEPLRPDECLPNQASATSFGPTGGVMLLFLVPFENTENRPFELKIAGEPPAPGQAPRVASFELDL